MRDNATNDSDKTLSQSDRRGSDSNASGCKYCPEEDVCEFYAEDRVLCKFYEDDDEGYRDHPEDD